jgi:hypothetical protein
MGVEARQHQGISSSIDNQNNAKKKSCASPPPPMIKKNYAWWRQTYGYKYSLDSVNHPKIIPQQELDRLYDSIKASKLGIVAEIIEKYPFCIFIKVKKLTWKVYWTICFVSKLIMSYRSL